MHGLGHSLGGGYVDGLGYTLGGKVEGYFVGTLGSLQASRGDVTRYTLHLHFEKVFSGLRKIFDCASSGKNLCGGG